MIDIFKNGETIYNQFLKSDVIDVYELEDDSE